MFSIIIFYLILIVINIVAFICFTGYVLALDTAFNMDRYSKKLWNKVEIAQKRYEKSSSHENEADYLIALGEYMSFK